jgi:hypothetical protein
MYGGFVGLMVGLVAGLVLRLLRGRPLAVALVGVWAGVTAVAAAAAPWIRRTPSGPGR